MFRRDCSFKKSVSAEKSVIVVGDEVLDGTRRSCIGGWVAKRFSSPVVNNSGSFRRGMSEMASRRSQNDLRRSNTVGILCGSDAGVGSVGLFFRGKLRVAA